MTEADDQFVAGCDLQVHLAPGADKAGAADDYPWVNITDRVRVADGISIDQGRREGASAADPSRCGLTVDNANGDFCRTNPAGQWYGLLTKNTPLRVRVRPATAQVTDSFTRSVSAGWGSSTGGGPWSGTGAGGTVQASDFDVTGSAGTHEVPTTSAYRYTWLEEVQPEDVDIRVTCTVAAPTGGDVEPTVILRSKGPNTYYMARVVIAPGNAVSLTLISMIDAVGTTLATASTSLTHSGATPLKIRAQISADVIRAKVWQGSTEPEAWTVTGAATSIVGAGWFALRSGVASGNSNAKPVVFSWDDFSATLWVDRFYGEVPQWPPRWDRSGVDATVPIVANGISRRLGRGNKPLISPVERALSDSSALYYWPLEDESGTDVYTSGVPGGKPLVGSTRGAGYADGPPGGAGRCVEVVNSGGYTGRADIALVGSGNTSWTIKYWAKFNLTEGEAPVGQSTAYLGRFRWSGDNPGDGWMTAYWGSGNGGPILDIELGDFFVSTGLLENDTWYHIRVTAEQTSATGVRMRMYLDGVQVDSVSDSPFTIGALQSFQLGTDAADTPYMNNEGDLTGVNYARLSHLAVYTGISDSDMTDAGLGYPGEEAHDRISRLCSENGIDFTTDATSSSPMGSQATGTLPQILADCEFTDGGLLTEYGAGYRYQSREERYNQAVSMTLDREAGDLGTAPEPTDDDEQVVNDAKARRPRGGFARYVATGPFSPDNIGRYDREVSVNVSTDEALEEHAQWRVHLGTVDDLRWPALTLADLAAHTDLIDTWLTVPLGGRVQVTNPPDEVGPSTVDVLVDGYTETIGWRTWTVTLQCVPAAPWSVPVLEGAGAPEEPTFRLDSDASTLASGIDDNDTSLSVATTGAPIWTTTATFPGDFPFDIGIGGEQMTVTAITGASSPQTFTVTRAVNSVALAHSSGAEVRLWRPGHLGL